MATKLHHEQLYRGSDLGRVNFGSYLRSLVVGIARGHVDETRAIHIAVESDEATLAIDSAVPAGLIVHELVSNAVKHAFPEGGPGSITVTLRSSGDGWHVLGVSDDGAGTADDGSAAGNFGKRLIALLVQQLDAQTETVRDHGTTVRVRFRDSIPPQPEQRP